MSQGAGGEALGGTRRLLHGGQKGAGEVCGGGGRAHLAPGGRRARPVRDGHASPSEGSCSLTCVKRGDSWGGMARLLGKPTARPAVGPLASAFASTRGRAHEQTAAPSHAGPMARGLMADGTRARRPQAQQLPKQRAYSVHTTNKWRHRYNRPLIAFYRCRTIYISNFQMFQAR